MDIYEDVSSPEVTQDNVGRPMTCWYRFRSFRGTPRDWILRIRFKKFKVGTLVNATTCHMGFMQVRDLILKIGPQNKGRVELRERPKYNPLELKYTDNPTVPMHQGY